MIIRSVVVSNRRTYVHVCYTRGPRRGRLMPACGSAHARNGRGCRKIESINATVLPRGARRNLNGWVRLGGEMTKRTYTLHPELYVLTGWTHRGAPYPSGFTRRKAASTFAPYLPIIVSVSFGVCLWAERFRRHNNSSKQQQSQPNIFAVAVTVVALVRSLYFLSQSSPYLLAQLLLL